MSDERSIEDVMGADLVEREGLSPDQLSVARTHAKSVGGAFTSALLEKTTLSEDVVLASLARSAQLPMAPTAMLFAVPRELGRRLPRAIAIEHRIVPLEVRGRRLKIAAAAPLAPEVLDQLQFAVSMYIEPHVAIEARVEEALSRMYGAPLDPRWYVQLERLDAVDMSDFMSDFTPPAGRPKAPDTLPPAVEETRWSVDDALAALRDGTTRDALIDVTLRFAFQRLARTAAFVLQKRDGKPAFVLWDAKVSGAGAPAAGAAIPVDAEGVLQQVYSARAPRIGPVDADDPLAEVLGGPVWSAMLAPVLVAGRVVAVIYGDRGADMLPPATLAEMHMVVPRLSRGLERLVREKKAQRGIPAAPTTQITPVVAASAPVPTLVLLADEAGDDLSIEIEVGAPVASPEAVGAHAASAPPDAHETMPAPEEGPTAAAAVAAARDTEDADGTGLQATPAPDAHEANEDGAEAARDGENTPNDAVQDGEAPKSAVLEGARDAEVSGTVAEPETADAAALDEVPDHGAADAAASAPDEEVQSVDAGAVLESAAAPPPVPARVSASPGRDGAEDALLTTWAAWRGEDDGALHALVSALHTPGAAGRAAVAALREKGAEAMPALAAYFPGRIAQHPFAAQREQLPAPEELSDISPVLLALGPDLAAPILVGALDNADRLYRYSAVFLLESLVVPSALRRLGERLFDPELRVAVRAAHTLRAYRDESAYEALMTQVRALCRDGTYAERRRAMLAVRILGDAGALSALCDSLGSDSKELVEAAQAALVAMTKQDFGTSERKWRAWCAEHGTRTRVEWLMAGLVHKDAERRLDALVDLRLTTGAFFGFQHDASRADRDAAVRRWLDWWDEQDPLRWRRR